MDYSDKDDSEALLYTTTICNSDEKIYTFDIFRQTLANGKVVGELVATLEKETMVLAQFQKKTNASDGESAKGSPGMISGIISDLIMSGLDAHYALNEMELCDLPLYLETYEQQKKERMEESRMWTYFVMLPHIDAKKLKNGARDLITFPWEEEETLKEAQRAIKEDADRFESFMNLGKNFIKS